MSTNLAATDGPLKQQTEEIVQSANGSARDLPLISLLMPSMNPGPFLADALESVLSQDYPNWELLVQDACSTDGSVETLLEAARREARISVQVESDAGQSDALNRALARASGGWVGWLNADDLLCEGALTAVAGAICEEDAPITVYGDWGIIDSNDNSVRSYKVGEWSPERFESRGCYIFSGAIFWPRQLLVEAGGWSEGLHYCMDLDLVLRLRFHPAKKASGMLAVLRWHEAAKSSQYSRQFLREAWKVRQAHSQGWRQRCRLLRATAVMLASTATTSMRFGRIYSSLRPIKRY